MNHLENACESVDASVFSGDLLFVDEKREMLKTYIGRWTRAIYEHEGGPPRGVPPTADELDAHEK